MHPNIMYYYGYSIETTSSVVLVHVFSSLISFPFCAVECGQRWSSVLVAAATFGRGFNLSTRLMLATEAALSFCSDRNHSHNILVRFDNSDGVEV